MSKYWTAPLLVSAAAFVALLAHWASPKPTYIIGASLTVPDQRLRLVGVNIPVGVWVVVSNGGIEIGRAYPVEMDDGGRYEWVRGSSRVLIGTQACDAGLSFGWLTATECHEHSGYWTNEGNASGVTIFSGGWNGERPTR